LGSSVL